MRKTQKQPNVAKKYESEATEVYQEPREIILKSGKKRLFTDLNVNSIDNPNVLQMLRLTDVALWSMTPTDQANFVVDIIQSYFTKYDLANKIITDTSGCIGGNTYAFINIFKIVNFVEISGLHIDIFKYNAALLNIDISNVIIHHSNYIDIYQNKQIKQDIIFMDPPWGGPNYYMYKNIDLYYNKTATDKVSVTDMINNELYKQAAMIILKCPTNFNVNPLLNGKYMYRDLVVVENSIGKAMYYLIILSKTPQLTCNFNRHSLFQSVGYRSMKWDYL